MLGTLVKKKLDLDRMANIFINATMETVEHGYEDVAHIINEDPVFIHNPKLEDKPCDHFLMIVMVANLEYFDHRFDVPTSQTFRQLVYQKLAKVTGNDTEGVEEIMSSYSSFMSRVNHPSKNVLYSMSKGLFHKYDLNNYQDEYFKRLNTPNPLFLKRLDKVMNNFLWDWEQFFKRHKLVMN